MQKKCTVFRYLFFISTVIVSLTSSIIADTFVVTNTNDSGLGSLRQSMIAACDSAEPDTIIFNIPISDPGYDADMGVWKIQPISALPEMRTDSTVIDGISQAAFISGDPNPLGPEIVVDGLQAGEAIGFYFHGSNNDCYSMFQCGFDRNSR